MCKFNPKNDGRFIDPCMINLIAFMKVKGRKLRTVACCCGHGKYPMTIVAKDNLGHTWELINNKIIERKKKFYKKDKQGYYYIPEVLKNAD